MKRKILNFLLTLILIVPCSIVFAACEEETPYHRHNAWNDCLECNEIIHFGKHELTLDGYNEDTNQDIYKCKSCDFILPQRHKHEFNKYKITPSYHWDVCGICDYESSSNGAHQYGTAEDGWTSNCTFENGIATCVCVDCGHKKTVTLMTFENDVNGSIEVLSSLNNNYIIKPVANEGYYFDKWKIHKEEYNTKSLVYDELGINDTESIQPILTISPRVFENYFWTYSLKPVFTKTEPSFNDIEVVLNVENDIDVEIEYMFYNNANGTQISYYLPENNNVVLEKISTIHSAEFTTAKTHYNSTNYDGSFTLPLGASCGSDNVAGKCEKVEFTFKDVRNRHFAKVKYNINGEVYDLVADKTLGNTDTFVSDKNGFVTIEKGAEKYQDRTSISYYYVEKWLDEEGNVVSNNKKFKTNITENRVFTAIMKKADVIYPVNDVVYLFSKNEGETLSFEALYSLTTAGSVEIPNAINEKIVTTIGNNPFVPTTLSTYGRFVSSITIPESVVNFDKTSFHDIGLCDVTINGYKANLTFEMFKNSKFSIYSSVYETATTNSIYITPETLNNMTQTLVKSFVDSVVTFELVDSEHLGKNILGHYESGTKKICLLQTDGYSFATLAMLAYELRHFYQDIAIGNVEGLTVNSLIISPTENQVGSWKHLDYADKTENPDAYWFNARKVDAREYAENLLGCNIFEQ